MSIQVKLYEDLDINVVWENPYFFDDKFLWNPFNVDSDNPCNTSINWWSSTYTFSLCDSNDKYSLWYYYCIWVVASGIRRSDGKKVSFLTHADTLKFNISWLGNFPFRFAWLIESILDCVQEDSFDIWVFWWSSFDDNNTRLYWKFLLSLDSIVRKTSWKALNVLIWPSKPYTFTSKSNFYYDNDKEVLHSNYPKQKWNYKPWAFQASEVFDILNT
jgi:hypothetical protein